MLARVIEEQRLEVWAACGENNFVSLNLVAITCERYINKRFTLQQLIKHTGQVRLVIVPAQAKLLRIIFAVVVAVVRIYTFHVEL
jgi:hypothetical protein